MDITDRSVLGRFRSCQEFLQRAEKHGDLPVVLLDLAGQIAMCGEDFPESRKYE